LPFTFAHPAVVLPLRKRLILSALVIGAMAPDFAYFLHPSSPVYTSHTFEGTFRFCLPVGFLVLWLFHRLIKRAVITLFPESHQKRLVGVAGPFEFWSVQRMTLILVSLLVGILSHFAWDSISHNDGWVVERFAWMTHDICQIGYRRVAVYDLIWYASTAIGVGCLLKAYLNWYASARVEPLDPEMKISAPAKVFWIACIVLPPAALSLAYTYMTTHFETSIYPPEYLVFRWLAASISMTFGALVIFSLGWACLRAPIVRRGPQTA